jgi:hypothetical protein
MVSVSYNRFQAHGSASDLEDLVRSCCEVTPDGQLALALERIVPIPRETKGNAKVVRDWKVEHWSADWVQDFKTEQRTATRLMLRFGSPGVPPVKIYLELARRFPEIKFEASFADGGNGFAHLFKAYRGEVISTEREATDEDWEAATGETVEEMEHSSNAARAAWEARNPRQRPRKPITHPRFWLRHWRVRRALKGYPIYNVPHKKPEGDLPEVQARENFDYFMRVRLERLAFFQSWLRNFFSVDASLTPAGVHGVNRWVDQFGGGLIGDDSNGTFVFVEYQPRWEGAFAGYNVMVDLGIFMGEYIILRRPRLRWEMDQGEPNKSVSSQRAGYRKPCLMGFPRGWTNDVIQSGNGCIEGSHQTSKVGDRASDSTNVVLRVVRSALYTARLPDGDDPFIFGDSSQEPL